MASRSSDRRRIKRVTEKDRLYPISTSLTKSDLAKVRKEAKQRSIGVSEELRRRILGGEILLK
jgi:hypothetical protein